MPNKATSVSIPRYDITGSLLETKPMQNWAAESMFTPTPVGKNSGTYGVIPLASLTQRGDVKRAAGSTYSRGESQFENGTFSVVEYGREESIDDGEATEFADYYTAETSCAARAREIVSRELEIEGAGLITTATFLDAAATAAWTTVASSDPIADVNAARVAVFEACGLQVDTIQIPFTKWNYCWQSAKVRDNIKYVMAVDSPSPTDASARQALARVLGLSNVIVTDAVYNTANEGQTESLSQIWSATQAFVYVSAQGTDIQRPCALRTFYNAADCGLGMVEQYRDESRRSDVYRFRTKRHQKVILPNAGYIITGI